MASTFKSFLNSDITTTRTLLHESIPLTGSIVARTYVDAGVETNIKEYGHGMLQSVYDYPYLSSSSNHILDITLGVHETWAGNDGVWQNDIDSAIQYDVKRNIYTQMSQMLVGYDQAGVLRRFDRDGNFSETPDDIYTACAFLSFSRLLVKDEIKKGTFELHLGVTSNSNAGNSLGDNGNGVYDPEQIFGAGAAAPGEGVVRIYDRNANNEFRVNSPVGEYGILYASDNVANGLDGPDDGANADDVLDPQAVLDDRPAPDGAGGIANHVRVGLIYYQAGIVVLNLDVLRGYDANTSGMLHNNNDDLSPDAGDYIKWFDDTVAAADVPLNVVLSSNTINDFARGLRERIFNIQFNNTTELNSTIYFCRANHNEFNYSSNQTYLSGSRIRVKENNTDMPVSYITTVGLYSADNELLAVAKVSEPLKKDPTNELTLRVRLDY